MIKQILILVAFFSGALGISCFETENFDEKIVLGHNRGYCTITWDNENEEPMFGSFSGSRIIDMKEQQVFCQKEEADYEGERYFTYQCYCSYNFCNDPIHFEEFKRVAYLQN